MDAMEHGREAIDHAINLVADEILDIDADGGYLLNVTWLAADSELLTKLIDWREANPGGAFRVGAFKALLEGSHADFVEYIYKEALQIYQDKMLCDKE